MRYALILCLLCSLCTSAQAREALRAKANVAFFGIHLIDTSVQSAQSGGAAEQARIALLEAEVREQFQERGFVLMDLTPIEVDLNRIVNPAKCYGCDLRMGQKLGADYILLGEVQKVSNLILSMNLVVKDPENGTMLRGRSVDIRGNTDDSWLRGMRYLLKTEIFKE